MGAHNHFPCLCVLSDVLGVDRCTKTAFIEIIFFVWCTLTAQIILNARYRMILSMISVDPHLIFTGSQDIRHYDEEHCYRRSLRMHNYPSVCVGGIHDSIGSHGSRYGVHHYGHLFSGR